MEGSSRDVKDAAEAGADLCGEADALAFAAGERGGGAIERQVGEADRVEELEALDDLALETVGDQLVAAGEVHGAGGGQGAVERKGGEVGDGGVGGLGRRGIPHLRGEMWGTLACGSVGRRSGGWGDGEGEGYGKGLRAEPATVALGAAGRGHVLHHVLAVALGPGVFEVGAEIGVDAVEAGAGGLGALRAVEEEILLGLAQFGEGALEVDLVLVGRELDEAEEIGGGGAGAHGAVEQGLGPVGDGLGRVEVVDGAQAVALGAGAIGGVEGEGAGLQAGDVDAAVRAGHGGGEEGFDLLARVGVLDGDENQAVGHGEGLGDGGLKALGVVLRRCGLSAVGGEGGVGVGRGLVGYRAEDDAVHDGLDGVVFALFKAHALGDLGDLAVDADAKALLIEGFELVAELALAAANDRCHDGDALRLGADGEAADGLLDNAGNDLFGGLARDGAAAVRAVRLADRGPKEAQVVVDLRDGADGGAGRARGGLLLDGDGGGETVDGVDVGALHLVEELAGVGGEGFDIAALAFGVDGVKREGALAGAGQAGDDREGVAGDANGDVFEVVLTRAAHSDVRDAGGGGWGRACQAPRIRHCCRAVVLAGRAGGPGGLAGQAAGAGCPHLSRYLLLTTCCCEGRMEGASMDVSC